MYHELEVEELDCAPQQVDLPNASLIPKCSLKSSPSYFYEEQTNFYSIKIKGDQWFLTFEEGNFSPSQSFKPIIFEWLPSVPEKALSSNELKVMSEP